jgi:hypothetical protein
MPVSHLWAGLDRSYHFPRLLDLGKLRRRRETFERRGEDAVGVGRATSRLIKPRELQRRLQAEAARALTSRDGDSDEVGFLGAGGICRIGLQEDVGADAVKEPVGPALPGLLGQRQRLVDPRQGALRVLSFGFELGEPALEEGRIQLVSLVGVRRQGLSKLRHAGHLIAEPSARPTGEHRA